MRFIAILSVLFSWNAFASVYEIDEGHSTIGFNVKHLGITNTKGNFNKFSGAGTYDDKSGTISDLKVTIDVSSIDTRNAKRDEHLRSPDFFDTGKYKEIKFESTKVVMDGKKPKEIKGKLTMHGITNEVTLKVTSWGTATDPYGNEKAALSLTGQIDRTKYDVKWNKPLEKKNGVVDKAKDVAVSNEVDLLIDIEANKKGTQASK